MLARSVMIAIACLIALGFIVLFVWLKLFKTILLLALDLAATVFPFQGEEPL